VLANYKSPTIISVVSAGINLIQELVTRKTLARPHETMSSPKLVTVYGATGLQGGSVVESLLKDTSGDFKVRGITRNTNSEKSKALASRGVEMVQADGHVYQQVVDALKGSWGFFANTNSEDPVSRGPAFSRSVRKAALIVQVGIWEAKWPLRD
jgi:hypothetical protein